MIHMDIASSSSSLSSPSQTDDVLSSHDVPVPCVVLANCSDQSEAIVAHVPSGDLNYQAEALTVPPGDLNPVAAASPSDFCVVTSLVPAIHPP